MSESNDKIARAIEFAAKAHEGAVRKGTQIPYITHPIEVATIVSEMTDDEDVIIAALLHDVIEDTSYTAEDIAALFGERAAELVKGESENKREDQNPADTWLIRKEETIEHLKGAERDIKLIALADKLSNLRSTAGEYRVNGDEVFNRFNEKDKSKHEWYYRNIARALADLSDTPQWEELAELCDEIFD